MVMILILMCEPNIIVYLVFMFLWKEGFMRKLNNSYLLSISGGVSIATGNPRGLTIVISAILNLGRNVGSFLKQGFC